MVKKIKELTPKQEIFCREYLIDLNATRACKAAGYAPNNTYKILNHPSVQKRIYDLNKERCEILEIDADFVLNELISCYRECREKSETYDMTNALKALNDIGRHVNIRAFDNSLALGQAKDLPPIHINFIQSGNKKK